VRLPFRPSRRALWLLGLGAVLALLALLARVTMAVVSTFAAIWFVAMVSAGVLDFVRSRRAWRRGNPSMTRRLPSAFAIGVRKVVTLAIDVEGSLEWRCELYDYADGLLQTVGLPMRLDLPGGKRVEAAYTVIPTRRGEVRFAPADLRIRSRWGLCEVLEKLGPTDLRRVYPDFAQIARYAWLAGDRRLQEIGIKTYRQRGEGTDFKQLSEYRIGDPVRHIDWKATLRIGKPVIREFQDERDQNVLLLVDCGRRMRAHERHGSIGTSHFDQVLNAVMLLTHVALDQGDAVGAMTFGTPPGEERWFAPRKGASTLNSLMSELYDVQPSATHSDYVSAARHLLSRHSKRALVVIITNFRDEDSDELRQALGLLRSRHLVLMASLRERVIGEILARPASSGADALDLASAHLYEQSRRDAFNRLAARDALMVDAEPERLGVELVNKYHTAKAAGII
jgi:uncharacterized protein (DUF58 family)